MKIDKETADWCVEQQCLYCAKKLPIAPPPDGWNPHEWTHRTSHVGSGSGTVRCLAGPLRAALVVNGS